MPTTRTTRKSSHSPGKSTVTDIMAKSDTELESFKDMMKALIRDELKPIRSDIESLTTKFENVQKSLEDVVRTAEHADSVAKEASDKAEAVNKRVSVLEAALSQSRMEQKKLQDKTLQLELYSRRDNLRLEGITEHKDENCLNLVQETLSKMGIDPATIPIARTHRLGPYVSNRPNKRPIIFKLVNSADREQIWSKRVTLKGSRVWLSEDYPGEMDKKRKLLWPYVRAARQGDPNHPATRVSAYLRGDKIVINKQSYSTDQIDAIPGYIQHNVKNPPAIKKSKEVTLFFTKESPLSNFYPCDLVVDGITFNSAEQFLCYQKALLYDSAEVAAEILSLDDPKLIKQRAKRLANFDEASWHDRAGDILKIALMAKFTQNDHLKGELLSTGTTILGEASTHDLLFGIGLSLQNPNAMDTARWRGDNMQGKTLMYVREEIK